MVNKLETKGGLSKEERATAMSISQDAREKVLTLLKSLGNGKAKTYEDNRIKKGLDISYELFRNWEDYFFQFEKCVDEEGRAVPSELSKLEFHTRQRNILLPQVQESILLTRQK
jgi:hypothetical protein